MYEGQQLGNQTSAYKQDAAYGYGPGAVGGALLAGNAQSVRQRELPAALDAMERAANFLHETVNELGARMEGVLRPATPEPASTGQIQSAPPSSGYASTIHGQTARVTMLTERIQDLLRRLEV